MNAIEINHLTRRFGRTEAVHDLTLAVPTGNIFALLGANGAGKTTTIKMLMNLVAPTSGDARVLGINSRRLSPRERAQIGYVSENQQLPIWMSVGQFLDYCRPFYPTWDRALEKSLLAQFALPASQKLKNLSRGMLMKAALLSSLAYRPKLLVLDEPFSGLDPLVRDELVRGLLEVSAQGAWTILVSSHDIEEVERLCDRVALLNAGSLQFVEPTEHLLRRFRRVEVGRAERCESLASAPTPAHWREIEETGALVRFVDSLYDGEVSEAELRRRFPGATIHAREMTLREIFVSVGRGDRAAVKGASV